MNLSGRTCALGTHWGRPSCVAKPALRVSRCAPARAARPELGERARLAAGWKVLAPFLDSLVSDITGQEKRVRDYTPLSNRVFFKVLEALGTLGPEGERWVTRALDGGSVYLLFIPKQGNASFTAVDREELKQQQTCSALISLIKERLQVPGDLNVRVWWSDQDDPTKPGLPKGRMDDDGFETIVWLARSWVMEEQ